MPKLLLFLCLLAAQGFAGEAPAWLARVDPHQPGAFPPLRAVELNFRFGWSGLLAGRLETAFHPDRDGRISVAAKGRTVGAVRALWQLDATHESSADARRLLPVAMGQRERYRGMQIDTVADFTPEIVRVLREKTPAKGEVFKRRTLKLPAALDLHAAYRYLRSQPLEPGDKHTFVAFAGDSGFLATISVVRRESLSIQGQKRPAIRCEMQVKKIDKKRELVPYKKIKKATGWLSDDADRIPLRVEADIFVGKVWAELEAAPGDAR